MLEGFAWYTDGRAVKVVMTVEVLESEDWVELGMLPGVVAGICEGTVRMYPRLDTTSTDTLKATYHWAATPATALTATEALRYALTSPRVPPPRRYVCIGWDGQWFGFTGWGLQHHLVGDAWTWRVHLYSRMVTENPSCATANRSSVFLDREEGEDVCAAQVALLAGLQFAQE